MANSLTYEFQRRKRQREKARIDNAKEWITLYRRNWHIFAERVLGIKLKPFQQVFLYQMGNSDQFYSLCSRGSGKTFLTAIAAICQFCLYPYSEIVISASTEAQAGQLITNKIKKELIDKLSPYLHNMYQKGYIEIRHTETGGWQVVNNLNYSTIVAVAPIDSARGARATFLVLDEHRIMKATAVNKILMPMLRPRQAHYLAQPQYNKRRWIEEGKVFYLTSAGYKFEPYWRVFKQTFEKHYTSKRLRYNVCAIDIFVSIKYGIKSIGDLEKARSQEDEAAFRMEYLNETIGAIEDGYFTYDMFKYAQTESKIFIPPTDIQVRNGGPFFREKDLYEVRLVVADFAFVNTVTAGRENDNTIIICMSMVYQNGIFLRYVDYICAHEASDSLGASDKMRKLYYDYDADYIVFDSRSGGEVIYNHFTEPLECEARGLEWQPNGFTIANVSWHKANENKLQDYRERTVDDYAIPCLIPYIATASSNSNMWISLRKALQNNIWAFPVPMKQREDQLFDTGEFYDMSPEEYSDAIAPFGQMDALINEAVNLRAIVQQGQVRLHEPRNNTKDRIVVLGYGNDIFDSIENEIKRQISGSSVSNLAEQMEAIW